ncbi:MAG: NADH-quinone oxidoreductase subunit G [Nocardioidaceae bacterium]|nr:NADH-quinone oxidoreductase subunit G [Nocardioidaceae bacterium]
MTVTSTGSSRASDSANTPAVSEDSVTVYIDDVELSVPKGTLVIRAAERIGVQIPRFCDHPLLDPVGACRQCLVEVPDAGNGRPMPKPQASCTLTVADNMVVRTQATSPQADKAQQGIMEFLLVNHPLDCPICDKGGECPLQNQAMSNGRGEARFAETKRTFTKPINISAQVLLDRERCVLCARCTRFSEQIAGDPFIALIERGALQQVGIYEKEPFESYFSGNTIQICPVGALTSAAYRFRARPFDLVSTPSVCEHCASGCSLRTDHRRGAVTRRLAGSEPLVNEEWNCDKGRFGFAYARQEDRLTRPLVRDGGNGELRAASWPEAFAVAARGLAAANGRVGVLTGGRLTREDAYAYAKFARTALGTNDIDCRARPHSAEEADFLAAEVAGRGLGVTYADLEQTKTVVLAGFDPEDESPIVFLRLRKAVTKHGLRVHAVASHTTRGLAKLNARLVQTVPGGETAALRALADDGQAALDSGSVIFVGERLAAVPGALSAAIALAGTTGARLAWVPRRAGERGAIDAGCLPSVLPGGRAVSEAAARADLAAAWGVQTVPAKPGRDTSATIAAAADGSLGALLVGGVDPVDLPDPALARTALEAAPFVVSLEVRESEVTRRADVVLPVAAVAEKPGTFVDWEGRARTFGAVLDAGTALPDVRILAGIAEEMGPGLGFRTVDQARAELAEVGDWDGERPAAPTVGHPDPVPDQAPAGGSRLVLDTWKQLVDDGRMVDGDPHLRATGRGAVARLGTATLQRLGVAPGQSVTLRTAAGAVQLPVEAADLPDGVVWAPQHSGGTALRSVLGVDAGQVVEVQATEAPGGGSA